MSVTCVMTTAAPAAAGCAPAIVAASEAASTEMPADEAKASGATLLNVMAAATALVPGDADADAPATGSLGTWVGLPEGEAPLEREGVRDGEDEGSPVPDTLALAREAEGEGEGVASGAFEAAEITAACEGVAAGALDTAVDTLALAAAGVTVAAGEDDSAGETAGDGDSAGDTDADAFAETAAADCEGETADVVDTAGDAAGLLVAGGDVLGEGSPDGVPDRVGDPEGDAANGAAASTPLESTPPQLPAHGTQDGSVVSSWLIENDPRRPKSSSR